MPPSTPLTPTSYVVLGLLATTGPSTPYEMESFVDLSLGHFWSFPHSQLYSEPGRLAERGLVEETREAGGRRRRTFTLTDAGRAALQDWLSTPDAAPGGTEIRDLGLLRLFFGAAARSEDDVTANARAQARAHHEKLTVYDELVPVVDEPHVAATLRLGRAYERAAAAFWDELSGLPTPPQGTSLRFEVFVADLEATVDFYTGVLGFALVKDDRGGTPPYVALRRDLVHVGVVQTDEDVPAERRRPPTGVELVLEVDDLAAEVARIERAGWPLEERVTRRPWGLVDVRLLDTDGHYLRVTGRAGDDGGLGG